MDPETTLVLLDEWHNRGDFMLAPADPDPLRSWRTARYIVRRFCGPVWEARKLDKPMGHDWRHDASQLAGGPWVEILQPQPYATGRAELAARTMARSLVLIADRYCGGPGEAKRCLDKLPPPFVESTRAELRAEEEAAREKQRADSVTSPVFGDDASEPTGRQTEPDPPGTQRTRSADMLDHLQEVVRHAVGLAPGQVFMRSDWTCKRFVYVLPGWLPDPYLAAAKAELAKATKPCWLAVRVERNVYGRCLAGYSHEIDGRLVDGWDFDELRGPAGLLTSPAESARQALGDLFDWTPVAPYRGGALP